MTYSRSIALITAAGAVLRGVFLDRQPLWRDEAFTAVVVQQPIPGMLSAVSRDSAPPLQYLLEHAVAQVSTEPWALRLVSLVAGTALIPLVAAIARRAAGDRAALSAALVTAVLPATVIASRDARMYALAASLSCASFLLLWRAADRTTPERVAAYIGVLALGLWTQYFVALAAIAGLAGVAWWLRPPLRRLAVLAGATAVTGLTLVPWLLVARAQFSHAATPFWVEPVGLKTISGTVVQFFSGPPMDPGVPAKIPLQALQGIAVAAGAVGLLALIVRRSSVPGGARRTTAMLVAVGGGGPVLLALVSLWHPLLEARYASVLWTPLLAVTGIGISFIPRPRAAAALVAALALPAGVLSLAITHPQTADITPGGSSIGGHDIVIAAPSQYLLVDYYADARVRSATHVVGTDVPWFWGTAAYPNGAIVPVIPLDVYAGAGRIFWIGEPEDLPPPLPSAYHLTSRSCAIRVCVEIYSV